VKSFLLGIVILIYAVPVCANKNNCATAITGYKVVKNSVYPFFIDKEKACFFAFYTPNPEFIAGTSGTNNLSKNTLWYGYYKTNKPSEIIEFPKPSDPYWGAVCHINAVSFYDMNGDNVRDVTVIGSCDHIGVFKYRYPFVFIRQGNQYIFDDAVYTNLYGFIDLSITDIQTYMKNPQKYYKILRDRYKKST
jgi:hypothetical protein